MTKVENRLSLFVSQRIRRAEGAIVQAMVIGASHASVFTPVATSNLLNSQHKRLTVSPQQIKGTVSYTADYAKHVHDPNVKQTFRRSTARKEFLKLGFEEAEPAIKAAIRAALRS